MIGAIGVAPAEGSYSSRNAGPWGGNLDIKEIGAGTTMFLPVGVRGAHLALGDVHALQADGESSGTGIEIGADVTLRIQALDKALAPTLHFHRHGVLYTVGASACLATACRAAAEAMAGIVSAASGWDRDHGFMYVSLAADVRVGQFVCNTRTAYAALDLKTCPWPIHVPHALG